MVGAERRLQRGPGDRADHVSVGRRGSRGARRSAVKPLKTASKVAHGAVECGELTGRSESSAGETVHGGAAIGADRPRSHRASQHRLTASSSRETSTSARRSPPACAAPTLFLIAQDLTKMQVDTNVSEADVGRVRVNQPATFTVDAYPGRTFTGSRHVDPRGAHQRAERDHLRRRDLAWRTRTCKLFPGMTANVKILVESSGRHVSEGPQRGAPLSPGRRSRSRRPRGRRCIARAGLAGEGGLGTLTAKDDAAAWSSIEHRRDRRHVHRGDERGP